MFLPILLFTTRPRNCFANVLDSIEVNMYYDGINEIPNTPQLYSNNVIRNWKQYDHYLVASGTTFYASQKLLKIFWPLTFSGIVLFSWPLCYTPLLRKKQNMTNSMTNSILVTPVSKIEWIVDFRENWRFCFEKYFR